MRDSPEMDIPDSWEVERLEFSGNFKLIAEFEHELGARVKVRPHKTYHDQPGFCNAHRVTLLRHTGELVEIASGMDVEHVEGAKAAAIEAMVAHSAIRAFEPPEGWVIDEMKVVEYGKLDAVLHHESGTEIAVLPAVWSEVNDPLEMGHEIILIEDGIERLFPDSEMREVGEVLSKIAEMDSD